MVTSISVALFGEMCQYCRNIFLGMCYTVAFEGWTRHLAVALEGIARDDKDLPEGAQQPVIDDLEETCHGEGLPGC